MASLVTTSRMQQSFNVLIDIYHEFLLLFYCCVRLEIKLTTTTTYDGIIHFVKCYLICKYIKDVPLKHKSCLTFFWIPYHDVFMRRFVETI